MDEQHEQPLANGKRVHEVPDELSARRVDPLQIVEHQQHGLVVAQGRGGTPRWT